jgi:hypothetical protein
MSKVVLDPPSLAKLRQAGGRVEVCDESGRTVGIFLSLLDRSLFDETEFSLTREELQRFEYEQDRGTLDATFADRPDDPNDS